MSSKNLWAVVALSFLTACGGGGDHSDGVVSLQMPSNYALKWSDDFTSPSLGNGWTFDTGLGLAGGSVWGNNEKQFYRAENASVVDGKMVIQPAAISAGGDIQQSDITSYGLLATSARVKNQFSNLNSTPYGFYEIRAQIPCVAGAWPAIWMMGNSGQWPARGEIDIMEWFGKYFAGSPNQVQSAVHTTNYYGATSIFGKKSIDGLCTGYHSYQLHWTSGVLVMGVDGTEVFRYVKPAGAGLTDWPFDQHAHLILNVAVGGNLGGNVDVAQLPNMTMRVDWVKIWQP
jgi:beta-glucanase (GH16 family)